MDKLLGHFWADDISSMAQVLECLNPDYACSLNCGDEEIKPEPLCFLEEYEGEATNGRSKDEPELNESDNMPEHIKDTFPYSEYLLLVSIGNYS